MRTKTVSAFALVICLLAPLDSADAADAAQWRACRISPDYACVISLSAAAADEITESTERADSWASIAAVQASAGEFDKALASARRSGLVYTHSLALRDIAEALAKAGETGRALAAADGIEHARIRGMAFVRIASAQAAAGDVDEALATARSIETAYHRALAFTEIASIQGVDVGRAREAITRSLDIVEAVKSVSARATVLTKIASAQAKIGNTKRATETFARAVAAIRGKGGSTESWILFEVASAQAEAGDVAGALVTVGKIERARHRAQALAAIASVQTKAGDRVRAGKTIVQAKAAARTISNGYSRATAFAAIASVQTKAGDRARAGQTIAQAKAAARTNSMASHRAAALFKIASEQATTGDIEGAVFTAGEIDRANFRVGALAVVASARAKIGDSERARETIGRAIETAENRELPDPRARLRVGPEQIALAVIAPRQRHRPGRRRRSTTTRRVRLQPCRRSSASIPDQPCPAAITPPFVRTQALLTIARAFLEAK